MTEFIAIQEAQGTEVGNFLCWPVFDETVFNRRVKQLDQLGVEAVALGGPHMVNNKLILGKGHAGIVLRAMFDGREVALKCRRTDAPREKMVQEARILSKANEVCVGPRLYGEAKDFLVLEELVGPYLGDWVRDNLRDFVRVKENIAAIIDIAYRLDMERINHGELVTIRRHFIVTEKGPRVIDFESGSLGRTPKNLTCVVHSVFMHTKFAKMLETTYQMPDRGDIIASLRNYKKSPSVDTYNKLLGVIKFNKRDTCPEND